MAISTAKAAEIILDNAVQTHEKQIQMLDLVDYVEPDAGAMQNSGNFIWSNVQQHAPIISGWDMTGSETEIIEETYPSVLGTPKNDMVEVRIDDLRDEGFWKRRGVESGLKQASELNRAIAALIANTGSMFYRSTATSGYDFIAEAQALCSERQLADGAMYFALNDRDNLAFGSDLAARQTLQGRPEQTWKTGQIGQNIAGFDVYNASFLPNLAGGADPATTVTADVSLKPEGGSVDATTGVVTNVDYRVGTIAVTASANYNVGDRVTFANGGTTVKALALTDKTDTGQAMTFTIVAKPSGTSIQVYPKPIAADDAALSTLEKAYANIDTQILNTATVNRVNTDASNKTNIFWKKDSVEVIGGNIPAGYFKQFGGMKVVEQTMSNGQKMYLMYDADIKTAKASWRLFTWYGITNRNPSANGVAVTA